MVDENKLGVNDNDMSNKISTWGYSSFIITLTKSGFLGMGSYIMFKMSNIDTYIAAIIGFIIGFIPLLLFIFIVKNSENQDILDLNITIFGKKIGTILNIILNSLVFFMGAIILYSTSEFICIQYMPDTAINYIRILLLVPIVYAASKNINVIAKISQIIFIINLVIFILTVFGLFGSLDIENMFPILENGITSSIKSAIIYAIFATFPIFMLLIIPQSKVMQEKHMTRKIFFMYILSNIMLIIILFTTILILGKELIPLFRYPEYIALKRFELFTIIERLENTLSLQFIFNAAIYLILSFHFVVLSLKKVFKSNQKENLFPYIIGIIVFVLSNFMFKSSSQATEFIEKYIPYVLSSIYVLVIILVIALVIRKIKKSKIYSLKSN